MHGRLDGSAIDPHDAAAHRPHARGKHFEQAGLSDARHAMDIQREWAALLKQLEEGFDFPCASGEGSQRAFSNDVAQLLHHETATFESDHSSVARIEAVGSVPRIVGPAQVRDIRARMELRELPGPTRE